MQPIHISVLDRHNMGQLEKLIELPGEQFLRLLVSEPTQTVSLLVGDDWATTEPTIVAALASAPTKKARDEIKATIPALVPARFKGAVRDTKNCLGRQVIGHDFDRFAAASFDDACEKVRALLPDRFLAIHTTATERNTDGTWRLRAFEIIDREASPEEWDTRTKTHMRSLGEHDENALDVARLLYMPVRTAGYQFKIYEGPRTPFDSLPTGEPTSSAAPSTRPEGPGAQPTDRRKAARILAAAWPAVGDGRDLAQCALAGSLIDLGWERDPAIEYLCELCREPEIADEDRSKRTSTVDNAIKARTLGKPFYGLPTLSKIVGFDVRSMLEGTATIEARLAEADALAATATTEEGNPLGFAVGGWKNEPPLVEFLVQDLFPAACVGMVFGSADSLKTWLLFSLADALAAGRPWLGRFNIKRPYKVGIVDIETGKVNVIRRMYMLRAMETISTVSFPGLKPNTPEFWEAIKAYGFEVVIVDSLRKSNPGADENSSAESTVPLDLAAVFSEQTGCAVLFAHHATKATAEGWPMYRGSGAIEDQVDLSFAVKKTDVTAERKTVEIRCDKPGDMRTPAPFAVEVTFDDVARTAKLRHVEATTKAEPVPVDKNRELILGHLRDNAAGLPKSTLLEGLTGTNLARRRVLADLVIADVVREFHQPPRNRLFVMLSPHI
jgi:hypothetical protein